MNCFFSSMTVFDFGFIVIDAISISSTQCASLTRRYWHETPTHNIIDTTFN